MASLKLILRDDKTNVKGTAPVYLRITQNRKTRQRSTDIRLLASDWNEAKQRVRKSHAQHVVLNDELDRVMAKARTAVFQAKDQGNGQPSAADIVRQYEGRTYGSVFQFIEQYLDRRGTGEHYWDSRNIRTVTNKLRAFCIGEDLTFDEVDLDFLHSFSAWLRDHKGNSVNTRAKNLRDLRRIFKQAVVEGALDASDDPFIYFTISTAPTKKERLAEDEVKLLESLDLTGESTDLRTARDSFLFSLYCQGVRFGDLCALKWSNLRNGRLDYRMMKTGKTKSIKLSPPASRILEHYRGSNHEKSGFIFPLLPANLDVGKPGELRRHISIANATVNRELKVLGEMIETDVSISFHMARHTFADLARKTGRGLFTLMTALGHSKLQTTQTYLAGLDTDEEDELVADLFGA